MSNPNENNQVNQIFEIMKMSLTSYYLTYHS